MYGAEVTTSRGLPASDDAAAPVVLARELLGDSCIDWISVTDNPGGGPMLPPDWIADKFAAQAAKIVLHLACKDYNRIGLESLLWKYAAHGFDNILALTGDLATGGFPSFGTGVFDIDSVALIDMASKMNSGMKIIGRGGKPIEFTPTNFYTGCAVSPFKANENELIPQYYKLKRKIKAGAAWVLPQLGYDMRKFREISLYLKSQQINVPIIGNAYVLTKTAAKLFNSGRLAGCVVSDELLAEIEKQATSPDKGKKYFYELAAKQLAVFKGFGFTAGYIGGVAKPESFFEIIDIANSFSPDDWKSFYTEIQYPQKNEFYMFTEADEPVIVAPKKTRNVNMFYRFSRLVHSIAFRRNHGLHFVFKAIFKLMEKNPNEKIPNAANEGIMYKAMHWFEKDIKNTLYGCTDCGDCGLPDTAYLCPMNSCSKNQRNGPCGGSCKSRCEADDKDCIWTIAYDRLKYFNELSDFENSLPIVYNAALKGSSAWSNFYMNRDHSDD